MNFSIKNLLIIIFIGFNSHIALAQLNFEADVTRGCAPLTINVTNLTSGSQPNSILYSYDFPNSTQTPDTFHTYNQPGIYNIQMVGNFGATGTSFERTNYIEVLPSPIPEFKIFRCDSNRIGIEIIENTYEEYIIDWNDGSPIQTVLGFESITHKYTTQGQKNIRISGNYLPGNCGGAIDTLVTTLELIPAPQVTNFKYNSNSLFDSVRIDFNTVQSVFYSTQLSIDGGQTFNSQDSVLASDNSIIFNDSSSSNFCYFIKATDFCANDKLSPTFCTIKIDGVAENNQNKISYRPYVNTANFSGYELRKNGTVLTFLPNPTDTITYLDTATTCNIQYCYELEGLLNNNFRSISNTVCVFGLTLDTPQALDGLNISIENDRTELSWYPDSLADIYTLSRGFIRFEIFDSAETNIYNTIAPRQDEVRVCYRAAFSDACGNSSLVTKTHCPVDLKVSLDENNNRLVEFLPYEGWPQGDSLYIVEKINENGDVYFSSIVQDSVFNFLDDELDTVQQILNYRIRAISNGPDVFISYSLIYEIDQGFNLYLPNAFSPNNDGLNDIFKPIGQFAIEYELQIQNRWGQLMFVSKDLKQGWDGTLNGSDAPEGVYIYKVVAKDAFGRKFNDKNTLTLIR